MMFGSPFPLTWIWPVLQSERTGLFFLPGVTAYDASTRTCCSTQLPNTSRL